MSMTDDEILENVSLYWAEKYLGIYEKAVSWYITKMQVSYHDLLSSNSFENPVAVDYSVLWILAYVWGLLRWKVDWEGEIGKSPMPKIEELDTFPLEVVGIDWINFPKEEYIMMVNTFINDLSHAWQYTPEIFWSDESILAARYLFQTCKKYLAGSGI